MLTVFMAGRLSKARELETLQAKMNMEMLRVRRVTTNLVANIFYHL